MSSSEFRCEFCQFVSFANLYNKKRHFMRYHNFSYKKARTFQNMDQQQPTTSAESTTAVHQQQPTTTAVKSRKDNSAVLLYAEFMDEEDDELLLAINLDF